MSSKSLPGGIVVLGFVSMLMDISSEMIHSLLPLFMVSVLGASALSVGIVEGIAEATASISKLFSGAFSDWIGRRKPLLLAGYGLAALTKPLFPLATGIDAVLFARFTDRIGKGIRGAPRDALIADLTPKELRGAAYGLRQSLDTLGAIAGPALALALMAATHDDYRLVFWLAVLPAFLAVLLIAVGVKEPGRHARVRERGFPIHRREINRLDARYWLIVAFASVLTLARFSEAFLLLRADSVGLAAAYVPAILIVMNIAYALSAYPLGKLSDSVSKSAMLAVGIGALIFSDLLLAMASSVAGVVAGAIFWGLHMGATQGLLAAVVAETAPDDLRGTAFGLFNLVTGLALLVASVLAGALWMIAGPAVTFIAGAGLAATALAGLLVSKFVRS